MAGHSLGEITALVAAEAHRRRRRPAPGRRPRAPDAGGRAEAGCSRCGCGSARLSSRSPPTPASRSPTTTPRTSWCCRAPLDALDRAEELLRERKVRAKRLPVGGAFHSPLMEPAVAPFRELVEQIEFREPRVPVLSCVTAEPVRGRARAARCQALTSPVRWTGVMGTLQDLGATPLRRDRARPRPHRTSCASRSTAWRPRRRSRWRPPMRSAVVAERLPRSSGPPAPPRSSPWRWRCRTTSSPTRPSPRAPA